jgi:hypothetical protein
MLPDRRRLKLAKVGVEGSNPFARSRFSNDSSYLQLAFGRRSYPGVRWSTPGHHGRAGAVGRSIISFCDGTQSRLDAHQAAEGKQGGPDLRLSDIQGMQAHIVCGKASRQRVGLSDRD